jgi:alanine racemase
MLPGPRAAAFVRQWGLIFPVGELEAAVAIAGSARQPTQVVVEVDVGLERLGVGVELAVALVMAVHTLPGISLVGITTHLHGIGGADYLEWQLQRFRDVVDALETNGVVPALRLAESSATLGIGSHPWFNAVDPGHLLYGLLPRGRTDRPAWLQPALVRVRSSLLQVKPVARDQFASESPIAREHPSRIGVIPIGIADGLRALCCGEVLVHGRRCRVAGNMSLEHARIDLSDVPDARSGDEVVVVGRQGDQEITPDEVAEANGLGSAGLAVVAGSSVPRIYLRGGSALSG